MLIDGHWAPNITCPRCRWRHPAAMSCADAKARAEAERTPPKPQVDLQACIDDIAYSSAWDEAKPALVQFLQALKDRA